MCFWNCLALSMIQQMLAMWFLVSLPFLDPAVHLEVLDSNTVKPNLQDYLANVLNDCNCLVVWTSFGIALLRVWNENWPFLVLGHCWVFQTCWHIKCSTFTASSFRIWNSSAGIPSPPLASFIVMLPKAHLTSHFRMSGSRWETTPS